MNHARTKPGFQPLRGNTVGELEKAIAHFHQRLRHTARSIAGGDADLAKDMYQIAITHLWELDPSRFDDSDEAYVWRSLVTRMLMVRRDNEKPNPTRPPFALRFP